MDAHAPNDGSSSKSALDHLHEQVERAVQEIGRLRRDNARLAARVRELEEQPGATLNGTVFALDEDPDALRRKISGFIEAIDQHLGEGAPAAE